MLPNYRRCISCRKVDHKSAFWRVVRVFSSHQVQLDQGMGRSVYLCPQESCLQAAQKRDRLGRSLKTAIPERLYQTLWQRLATNPVTIREEMREEIPGAVGKTTAGKRQETGGIKIESGWKKE